MDFSAFEGIINKISGVMNSKIVVQDEEIAEIHVLANKLRSAKQIARDIESAVLVSFNYRIDRSKLSIAQIQTSDEEERTNRIRFEGLAVKSYDNVVECGVTLEYNDQEYFAVETGANTSSRRLKVAANATVKVLQQIYQNHLVIDIADVLVSKTGSVSFVCVLVNLVTRRDEETLVGSAIIKDDTNEAVVKATLDAINRRIQKS